MKIEFNINPKIFKKAKRLAREQNLYLGQLVANKDIIISKEVKQLPKGLKMPKNKAVDDVKYNYLTERYL